ncbi:unnamed protein product, partial [Iphiclides podalirius]
MLAYYASRRCVDIGRWIGCRPEASSESSECPRQLVTPALPTLLSVTQSRNGVSRSRFNSTSIKAIFAATDSQILVRYPLRTIHFKIMFISS